MGKGLLRGPPRDPPGGLWFQQEEDCEPREAERRLGLGDKVESSLGCTEPGLGGSTFPLLSSRPFPFSAMLGETAPPTTPTNGEWRPLFGAHHLGGFPDCRTRLWAYHNEGLFPPRLGPRALPSSV